MFTSVGIDNFELSLAVTSREARALKRACKGRARDDSHVLLTSSNTNSPLIILRFRSGKVFADLNAPKLTFDHNVRLAGPEQVENAIRVLVQNTEGVTPRLDWLKARVSRLHVTFTREVPDFEACAALCKAPRGYWPYTFDNENGYSNSKTKNLQVNWYDKGAHLEFERLKFPTDVGLEMESLEHPLFRFEARLNQAVLSELKKHGGWDGLSISSEDLFGVGFASAMTYLRWRLERHLPIPMDRTSGARSGMSPREYATLNMRQTANENTPRMRERANADHTAGLITANVLQEELIRIGAVERRALALSLHSALQQESSKPINEILVSTYGNFETPDFEHAARTPGHA
jgi:hypothetical protein